MFKSRACLTELAEDKGTTLAALRKMFLSSGTEKTREVTQDEITGHTASSGLGHDDGATPSDNDKGESVDPRPGHGRSPGRSR